MLTNSRCRAWPLMLLAALAACRTTATRQIPVAAIWTQRGLVAEARLLRPPPSRGTGFLEVTLLNCGVGARTIYWPSPHGSVSWGLEELSGGEALGGICAKGPVGVGRPVVIEPGQRWTLLCDADTFPRENRPYRLAVRLALETPDGPLTMTSKTLGDPEVVQTCGSEGDATSADGPADGSKN
jgi:hypothetical protein